MVLQVAMGWQDCHLHRFRGGRRYGPADHRGFDHGDIDESTVGVAEVSATAGQGVYEYDFGDSWEHRLLVEKADAPVVPSGLAACTAGERSCPPEDRGGVFGYANLLEALADPAHEEHDDLLEWVGEDFDPQRFDWKAANTTLQRLPFRTRSGG